MDSRLPAIYGIKTNKRVDLEVRKVEIHVYRVQADEEVDEGLFLFGGDVAEEGRCDGRAGGEWRVDGNIEFEGFRIDIADIYTTFVSEEDRITFAGGVDADVVLGVRWVRKEWLDDEVVEGPSDGLNLKEKKKKGCQFRISTVTLKMHAFKRDAKLLRVRSSGGVTWHYADASRLQGCRETRVVCQVTQSIVQMADRGNRFPR
jgi:hypothetical protein